MYSLFSYKCLIIINQVSLESVDKPEKHDFLDKNVIFFRFFVGIQSFHHDILVDKLFNLRNCSPIV